MGLYRGPPAIVVAVVVVVGAWASLAWATTDPQPALKHFSVYGCQDNSTLRTVNLKMLPAKAFLGFGGTFKTEISLRSKSSLPCKLSANVLFRVQHSTKDQLLTVVFHQVVSEGGDSELNVTKEYRFGESDTTGDNAGINAGQKPKNQEGNKQKKENTQPTHVTCNFTVGDRVVSLGSGYGFIFCPGKGLGDSDAGEDIWKEWLTDVTGREEEAARTRKNTVIGVAVGAGVIALLFMACILCRLKTAASTSYHSQRRPSNTSAGMRTGSTRDHSSSRP